MDLLLDLIKKNEINIYDIPINFITGEYLKALQQSIYSGIEVQVEFLYLASTLLSIKTRMLLPKTDGEEEDPRIDLVEQIIVYSQFKQLSDSLEQRMIQNLKSFDRLKNPYIHMAYEDFIIEEDVEVLDSIMKELTKRLKELSFDSSEKSSTGIIKKDPYNVEDFISKIMKNLVAFKSTSLKRLVTKADKQFIITSFLAILELLNSGLIDYHQEDNFKEIYLEKSNEQH
ncbi:MAG: segregation/condensation protein A [Tissierellia bacterium]|nr:segregation/condensation protein A [Tissierellia bacterium]